MKEILNLSGYSVDMERYNYSWEEVKKFVHAMECSGVELLIGGEYDQTIPRDLISSVHLPGWLGWIRLWREPDTVPIDCDPYKLAYYYGAASQESLIQTFCANLKNAKQLGAAYAVFHITHIELEDFFTRNHRYSSFEVLSSAASFLNVVCRNFWRGGPPVTLGFENLWWPGLTFLSQEEIDYFTKQLAFDNWIFVLDTGHMMNALNVSHEEEGIFQVLSQIAQLSHATRQRIKSVHFQCSVSGIYQKEHCFCDPPFGFAELPYAQQISQLMPMIAEIDQHRPFTNGACFRILEILKPEYVVHEFTSTSRKEFEEKIKTQKNTLKKCTEL